jgi:hypothetical protein
MTTVQTTTLKILRFHRMGAAAGQIPLKIGVDGEGIGATHAA